MGSVVHADLDRSMKLGEVESLEKVEVKFNELALFQEACDIKFLEYSIDELNTSYLNETLNFRHPAMLLAINDFQRFPNNIRFDTAPRLIPFIKELKAYGEVRLINYYSGPNDIPDYWGIKVIHPSGDSRMNIYFSITEVSTVEPKEYAEYKEDVIGEYIYYIDTLQSYVDSSNTEAHALFQRIEDECSIKFSDNEVYIEMIIQTQNGLATQKVKFDFEYDDNDLDLHYGEGFSQFHTKLVERINDRDKGIVMFHGEPGNGKTHYIRRLLPALNQGGKRVILIPKHILESLESPGFNHFMIQHFVGQKIIFVMEDAESIIAKRNVDGGGRSQLVSTLLNITDGILNDIFSIQVILTFNTDLESIDEALLRKGRLIAKFKFEGLKKFQAEKLAKHLNVKILTEKNKYSLAEVYALRESEEDELLINQNLDSSKKKDALGF